jgi:hypothetical protein
MTSPSRASSRCSRRVQHPSSCLSCASVLGGRAWMEGGRIAVIFRRLLASPVVLWCRCVITKRDEETIRNYIHGRDRNGAPVKKHAWLWRALIRGVAAHHSNLPRTYRLAVE